MSSPETRSIVRGVRFTPTEDATMNKQAQAEGYASVAEWLRDTALTAARGGDRVRMEAERIAQETGRELATLTEQIIAGTNKQVARGIEEIHATTRTTVETAVQEATARQVQQGIHDLHDAVRATVDQVAREAAISAVKVSMAQVLQSQENFRTEITDNLKSILVELTGGATVATTTGGETKSASKTKAHLEERQAEWMK